MHCCFIHWGFLQNLTGVQSATGSWKVFLSKAAGCKKVCKINRNINVLSVPGPKEI